MKVVLLHAFPLDERMWDPQRAALEQYDVEAPNLYALGGNTMDAWAASVLARLDGAVAAVGASMGGYVALAMARQAPDRIRGVLLAGSRLTADSPERREGRAATIELIRGEGPKGLWENQRDKLFGEHAPAEAVERAEQMTLDREIPELVRAIEAIRDRSDGSAVLDQTRVLLAVGAGDEFFPPEEAADVPAELAIFERSRHLPNLEQPDEFNRTLNEFLQALR